MRSYPVKENHNGSVAIDNVYNYSEKDKVIMLYLN